MFRLCLFACAALSLTRCAEGNRGTVPSNYVPQENEAVIVGRAFIRPPYESRVSLFFSDSPDTPMVPNGSGPVGGLAAWAWVRPDGFFVQRVPKRQLYLRVIQLKSGIRGGRARKVMWCNTSKRVPIQPDDVFVYSGTFVCEREHGAQVSSYDEFASLNAYWPRLIGDHVPMDRCDAQLGGAPLPSPPPPPPDSSALAP
jgi:hypothetical protein